MMALSSAYRNTKHNIGCEPNGLQAEILFVLGLPIVTVTDHGEDVKDRERCLIILVTFAV